MKKLLILLSLIMPWPVMALDVFTCEPEWASLVKEIAKDKVDVYSATNSTQDVHYIQAKPSLIANIRKADIVVCSGADLEVGWLPVILQKAGNASIQEHGENLIYGSDYVKTIEKPNRLDRADGDVHPMGNPHIHLNPNNLLRVGQIITEKLSNIDDENTDYYQKNYADFKKRMTEKMKEWQMKAKSVNGKNVITNHKNMSYLFDWLNIKTVGTLEPKPGIPANSNHLKLLVDTAKKQDIQFIAFAPFEKAQPANWLSKQTDIPAIKLPYTVGNDVKDLFELYDTSINLMLQTNRK